jgi:hypothetical protein
MVWSTPKASRSSHRVMVALGKLKPETIEFMLFALLGKQSERGKKESNEKPD